MNRSDIPLLTVCIITYNQEPFIRMALDGAIMQKVDFPIEILIADDYSTDGTRAILQEYADKYPHLVTLLLQESNVGAAQNWLDLLAYPKSKYIAYLEGDDYWTDEFKLQKQVTFLESNPEYTICYHPVYELYDKELKLPVYNKFYENHTYEISDLAEFNFISSPSVVYRRTALKGLPDWILSAPLGDYVLHLLYAAEGKIYFMSDFMAVYRKHINGLWSLKKQHENATKLKWVVDKMDEHFKYKYHDSFYSRKFLEDYYLSLMEHYKEQRNALKYFYNLAGFAKHRKKLQRSFGNLFLLAKQYFSHKITTS